MQNSDAVERNLILIANKKYGAEIQGMLNETNAELLNITNEYLYLACNLVRNLNLQMLYK